MRASPLRLALLLLLAGCVQQLVARPPSEDESTAPLDPSSLRVLVHNVYLMPGAAGFGRAPGRLNRAKAIGAAGYVEPFDIIVLNELFDEEKGYDASGTLLDRLKKKGFRHQTPIVGRTTVDPEWDETAGKHSRWAALSGGVAVASRYPIVEQKQYIFAASCGEDNFANKGFAYVRIDLGEQTVHVVGTHLQADTASCWDSADVRTRQLEAMATYLADQSIGDQLLIIAGDMNVDRGSEEYAKMLEILQVAPPTFTGHGYSADPGENDLVGFRDGLAAKPRHLDYAFARGGGAAQPFHNRTLTPSLPFPSTWRAKWWIGTRWVMRESDEFSDHFPIAAAFDETKLPEHRARTRRYDRISFVSRVVEGKPRLGRKNRRTGYLHARYRDRSWRTEFDVVRAYDHQYVDPYCLTFGNYFPESYKRVRATIRANAAPEYYWVPGDYRRPHSPYKMRRTERDHHPLWMERPHKGRGCLENGDIVSFHHGRVGVIAAGDDHVLWVSDKEEPAGMSAEFIVDLKQK